MARRAIGVSVKTVNGRNRVIWTGLRETIRQGGHRQHRIQDVTRLRISLPLHVINPRRARNWSGITVPANKARSEHKITSVKERHAQADNEGVDWKKSTLADLNFGVNRDVCFLSLKEQIAVRGPTKG